MCVVCVWVGGKGGPSGGGPRGVNPGGAKPRGGEPREGPNGGTQVVDQKEKPGWKTRGEPREGEPGVIQMREAMCQGERRGARRGPCGKARGEPGMETIMEPRGAAGGAIWGPGGGDLEGGPGWGTRRGGQEGGPGWRGSAATHEVGLHALPRFSTWHPCLHLHEPFECQSTS